MIGLEIHCQLTGLASKLFCPCKADYRGMEPNSNICPICMGIPGSLPRLNRGALKKAAVIARALNCMVPARLAFFRKNYFYPDLPKNFQITQLDIYGRTSIGGEGHLMIEGRRIGIRRVQLEEDPGRLLYKGASERTQETLVDYNRAGTALVEIVTEPDFESPRQVRLFLNILSDLLENLGVSDPALEGAMRADGNISVGDGPRVEIKNIASFHDLEKALLFEATRQQSRAARGLEIESETRHWDEGRKVTVSARKKEEDTDYRYFLEGDIPWVVMDPQTSGELEKMPESIVSKRERYASLGVPPQVADVLSSDKFYSDLFEEACTDSNARELANIITTDLMGLADTREARGGSALTARHLADLLDAIHAGRITRTAAKTVLSRIVETGVAVDEAISECGLGSMTGGSELSGIVEQVISEEGDAVGQARDNPQAINYLVGKVMKKTGGNADPKATLELLRQRIGQA